jgi:hypothetical protein
LRLGSTAHDLVGKCAWKSAIGDKFPKHIHHTIVCIGALVAHRDDRRWTRSVRLTSVSGPKSS